MQGQTAARRMRFIGIAKVSSRKCRGFEVGRSSIREWMPDIEIRFEAARGLLACCRSGWQSFSAVPIIEKSEDACEKLPTCMPVSRRYCFVTYFVLHRAILTT